MPSKTLPETGLGDRGTTCLSSASPRVGNIAFPHLVSTAHGSFVPQQHWKEVFLPRPKCLGNG